MNLEFVTLENHQVEVKVTPEMLAEARKRAEAMGCLNKHSYMKGERNVIGMLGELAVLKALPQATYDANHDHDMRLGKLTIDVKSKQRAHKPFLNFDCTVFAYNPNQKCDMYVFCSVKKDLSVVWVSGFILKPHFYKIAELIPAGTVTGSNRMPVEVPIYKCAVSNLNRISILQAIVVKKD